MDYAGLNYRNIRFPVDRSLTDEERAHRYRQEIEGNVSPMDYLSVIKLNNGYIELVDRWYPVKGFNTWLGACVSGFGILLTCFLVWTFVYAPAESEEQWMNWVMPILFLPFALGFTWGGWWLMRTECSRWTHYPVRLNRKTRQVHVFRQDGTVLTVPWDALFITLGTAKAPLSGTTYDLRAHILDADGRTVRESFTLGYPSMLGNAQSVDKFWAFLQPYMEAPDGVERTFCHLKEGGYLVPVDGRKESWRWSIARSFMLYAHWPWLQLLVAPVWGPITVGRMLAMWTSKQPKWPAEVEAVNVIAPDDPYQLTWRDNGPLGWWEFYWPLICTVLGVGAFLCVLIAMPVSMLG